MSEIRNEEQINVLNNDKPLIPKIEDMPTVPPPGSNVAPPQSAPRSRPKYVEMGDYAERKFVASALQAQARKPVMSGFQNIDNVVPLRPGLHVVGAISSLGKTSLLHQTGDQAAALGSHVLFFELEQDADTLLAKSISRYINLHANDDKSYLRFTADSIFYEPGVVNSKEVTEQLAVYKATVGNRMIVYPCSASITVDDIIKEVELYIEETNELPVIFIDYMQMLAPTQDVNGRVITDMRANVEEIMKRLQAFANQRKLVIFLVCALNRESYLNQISFSAFKESGMIEYGADVVWGMQAGIVSEPRFNSYVGKDNKTHKTTDDEKNKMILAEKAKDKRIVEIVILKNRNRPVGQSLYFEYEPRYSTFTALDENKKPLPSYTPASVPLQTIVYTVDTFAEWFWTSPNYGYQPYKKQMPSVGLADEQEIFAKDVPTLTLKSAIDNYAGHSELSGYSETEIREAIEKYWEENLKS